MQASCIVLISANCLSMISVTASCSEYLNLSYDTVHQQPGAQDQAIRPVFEQLLFHPTFSDLFKPGLYEKIWFEMYGKT